MQRTCIALLYLSGTTIHPAAHQQIAHAISPDAARVFDHEIKEHYNAASRILRSDGQNPDSSAVGSILKLFVDNGVAHVVTTYASENLQAFQQALYIFYHEPIASQRYSEAVKQKEVNASTPERRVAWAKFEETYDTTTARWLQQQIPELRVGATPYLLFRKNNSVDLTALQRSLVIVSLLMRAYGLQQQASIDPEIFKIRYKHHIQMAPLPREIVAIAPDAEEEASPSLLALLTTVSKGEYSLLRDVDDE
jgi:hypothetical protein